MKNILFLVTLFAYSIPASAAGLLPVQDGKLWGNGFSLVNDLDIPTASPARAADSDDDYDPAAEGIIADYSLSAGFPYFTYGSLMLHGGSTIQVEDRTFALKVGFLKGQYDDYVKTYKPRLVIFAADVTEFLNGGENFVSVMTMDIISGDSHSYSLPMDPNVDYQEKELEIVYSNWGIKAYLATSSGEEIPVAWWGLSDLMDAWAKAAEAYTVQYNGKKIYAVPQLLHDYMHGVDRFGFVLSEGSAFYHTTGLPLDFAEVCRLPIGSNFFSFRPVSYSLPLTLALEKLPDGNKWKLRDMDSSELTEALDQEAADVAKTAR